MSTNQTILQMVPNRFIPKLSMLKRLLGSNDDVAALLKKCGWFLRSDLDKTLMPNVEILKSCGLPMERILGLLYVESRLLTKPDIMRKSVDKAMKFRFSQSRFVYAAIVFSHTSEEVWEAKLQALRDLGFSDHDIVTMFRKQPKAFALSETKMRSVIELLLATGKYSIFCIVSCLTSLEYNIENRLEPRLQMLGVLESRNLIHDWPTLSIVARSSNAKIFDGFVRPYYDVIGEEQIAKYLSRLEGKKR